MCIRDRFCRTDKSGRTSTMPRMTRDRRIIARLEWLTHVVRDTHIFLRFTTYQSWNNKTNRTAENYFWHFAICIIIGWITNDSPLTSVNLLTAADLSPQVGTSEHLCCCYYGPVICVPWLTEDRLLKLSTVIGRTVPHFRYHIYRIYRTTFCLDNLRLIRHQ